jgi:hypothetical protein
MKNKIRILILFVFAQFFSTTAAPCGAVLIRNGQHLRSSTIDKNAEHKYFGELEGPAWENKYTAMRYYADNGNRQSIDIIGKYKSEPVLQYADDANFELHQDHSWGGDIFKVGTCLGLGSFNLFDNNGAWINPALGVNLDSITIIVKDSSVQTPTILVKYINFKINGGLNTVEWLISTKQDIRPTYCELTITGNFSGKVVVAMRKYVDPGVTLIKDPSQALLATLGKQAGMVETYTDTSLFAIYADKKYFSSFSENDLNYGMVLTPDAAKKVKWAMAYNWAKEPEQVYHSADWRNTLFPAITATDAPKPADLWKNRTGCFNNTQEQRAFDLQGKLVSASPSLGLLQPPKTHGIFIVNQLDKNGRMVKARHFFQ